MKETKHYKISKDFNQHINLSNIVSVEKEDWYYNPKFYSLKEAEKYVDKIIGYLRATEQKSYRRFLCDDDVLIKLKSTDCENDPLWEEFFSEDESISYFVIHKENIRTPREEFKSDLEWILNEHQHCFKFFIYQNKNYIFEDGDVGKILLDKLP